jgi:putative hydrolase of the HAD superfamily
VTSSKLDICVTFDLWGTLFIDKPELDNERNRMRCEEMHKVLSDSGVKISLEDIERGYAESAVMFQSIWRTDKEIPTAEQVGMILRAAGLTHFRMDPQLAERLTRAYVDPIFAAPPRLEASAVATLQEVSDRVRGIGLVSNTGRSPGAALREILGKYGIVDYFHSTIFSDETGFRKPDRKIFEKAATELRTEPAKIVHIGDDPEADIWGAKNAGMRAILLDYPVPEGFKQQPGSLLALSRSDRRVPDSEIRPDRRIGSLKETLNALSSMN